MTKSAVSSRFVVRFTEEMTSRILFKVFSIVDFKQVFIFLIRPSFPINVLSVTTIFHICTMKNLKICVKKDKYYDEEVEILTLRNNFRNEICLQGLLDLEGDLTPILVSLVKSNNYATGMLDTPAKVEASLSRYANYV